MAENLRHQVDEAYARGVQSFVHPNGILMLPLNEEGTRRLHIYDKSLPRQENSPSPIHNHKFDFESVVVLGKLINLAYGVAEIQGYSPEEYPNAYIPHRVVDQVDSVETTLAPAGPPVIAVPSKKQIIPAADSYSFMAGRYHESLHMGRTATVFEKGAQYHDIQPTVLVPTGMEPENDYLRAVLAVEDMRALVYDTLDRIDEVTFV